MMARFERVEVESKDRDQYGRVVGLVYLDGDGECLTQELVGLGTPGSMSYTALFATAITGKCLNVVPDKRRKGSGRRLIPCRPGIGGMESGVVPVREGSVQAERIRIAAFLILMPKPRGSLKSISLEIHITLMETEMGRRMRGCRRFENTCSIMQ